MEDLILLIFSNKTEYDECLLREQKVFEARWLWGLQLRDATANSGSFEGWCGICDLFTDFWYQTDPSTSIDLREEMACTICGLSARMRAALGIVLEVAPSREARIYSTEQATPGFRCLAGRYPNAIGSEYFSEDQRTRLESYLEALMGWPMPLRFEDATHLDMSDDSVDVLMSCDVLEHVPDHRAALEEFGRVIRPGGHLVLTVPFLDADETSMLRARIDENGVIEHLLEPEYHGDPVCAEGILAYHSFGWSLLQDVRSAGFTRAYWCLPWNPSQGLFTGLWTLHAVR